MTAKLQEQLQINEDIASRILKLEDAPELFSLVDSNREFLKEWLPWLDFNTEVKHSEEFIQKCLDSFNESKSFIHGIFYKGEMVGNGGLHSLDYSNAKTSIGYWLAKDFNGKGIVTSFCRELIRYSFEELNMNRVEILACPDNKPSCGVAERLGLKFEGVKRQNEKLYDRFLDHHQYSILKEEWD